MVDQCEPKKHAPITTSTSTSTCDVHIFHVFGRTELMIGVSEEKNCKQSAGDVCFGVAPRKPSKNTEMLISR